MDLVGLHEVTPPVPKRVEGDEVEEAVRDDRQALGVRDTLSQRGEDQAVEPRELRAGFRFLARSVLSKLESSAGASSTNPKIPLSGS